MSIFFMNGKKKNWAVGREFCVWGLPVGNINRYDAENYLSNLGLIQGSSFIAISGPYAYFKGKIDAKNGIYYSKKSLFYTVNNHENEVYPVRINFNIIEELNRYWYTGPKGNSWRYLLNDVYYSMSSLYVLRNTSYKNKYLEMTINYGQVNIQ